jgi:hypothetical protein
MQYWKLEDNSDAFDFEPDSSKCIKCTKKEYIEIRKESAKRYLLTVLKPGDKQKLDKAKLRDNKRSYWS